MGVYKWMPVNSMLGGVQGGGVSQSGGVEIASLMGHQARTQTLPSSEDLHVHVG